MSSPPASASAATLAADPAAVGLDAAEVAERRQRGQVNVAPAPPSRTLAQILRANLITPINGLLVGLFVVIVAVAPLQDATFGLVVVFNVLVGSVQEVRAKRTLDRLTILAQPRARVVRGGVTSEVEATEVVIDDVVDIGPGDQLVVDGEVLVADGLEVDESLLTGEAEPQPRGPGERLLSGSFVTGGSGRYRATQVGGDAYAAQLAEKARRFSLVSSDLQAGIGRILRLVTIAMVPAAILLVTGQMRSGQSWRDGAQRSVGGLVPMVPEGLVLLTSVAFAVGVIRLGRRQCLVKELPAVEILARTTVVCLDKTGTLTDGQMAVNGLRTVGDGEEHEVADALGAMAAADPHPNATLAAVAERFVAPAGGWAVADQVAFTSARKWSATTFDGRGTWFLGAPEILLGTGAAGPGSPAAEAAADDGGEPVAQSITGMVADEARQGRRVVLLAWSANQPGPEPEVALPADLRPRALVMLEEQVRSDAAATIAYFRRQGVQLRVISGDNPLTVGAVAARVGVPGADRPFDARQLPEGGDELADVLAERTVYGRVTPQQKQDMVAALQARGQVVAMTGDGVNDVLALKDADLGIAMGGGTAAARAVARVVLLDGSFASLPAVVGEGRRVIANIERVANLFITKTAYAVLLAVVIGLVAVPYPFLPRHFTLISAFAIGIPAFFLALAPSRQPARPHFVRRVVRFVAVSGPLVGIGVLVVYFVSRAAPDTSQRQSQTAATIALLGLSLVVLLLIARPLTLPRVVLAVATTACAGLAVALPRLRQFFDLDIPDGRSWMIALVVVAAGALILEVACRRLDLLPTAPAALADGAEPSEPSEDAEHADP